MSTTKFNYKFIKENASAGSWRRGYEYHTKDMVFDNYPEKNFYMGKVKGNFQEYYNTDLIFKRCLGPTFSLVELLPQLPQPNVKDGSNLKLYTSPIAP